jgi:D-beta-D-heptose 7-phosphate kinase/D-beta-D-heptose 1-phosphate adenosyltransferase
MAVLPSTALHRHVLDLSGKTVLIIGDLILDEFVFGDVRRISPEAPVPVVDFQKRTYLPGGAANVANNILSLGCRPLVAGVVGPDRAAEQLTECLRVLGISTDGLFEDRGRPTSVKLRIVAHSQQVVRLDHETRLPITQEIEERLLDWFQQHLVHASACVISDYGKGVTTATVAKQVISRCARAGIPVLVDPKSLAISSLFGATLIKPNKSEAERLAKVEIDSDADLLQAGQEMASELEGTAVLVTRGAQGMVLFRRGLPPHPVPAQARNVFDVTGAGDTVVSIIAAALAAGISLEDAVRLASHGAAIVVGKLGTATLTLAELKSALTEM